MAHQHFWPASFDVRDYGADPTGERGSGDAFEAWAAAITEHGGGVGFVPAGTYLIDRVGRTYATDPSESGFVFENCNGLQLIGYGAVLKMENDVDVAATVDEDGNVVPPPGMYMPFFIRYCTNVRVEGFEIDGQIDRARWDPQLDEVGGFGVGVFSSSNVTLQNLRIHHSWMDGISIQAADSAEPAADRRACRSVVVANCEVYASFRCNIAVHEARHVRITDCRTYGAGLGEPQRGMGIDIEPDLWIGADYPVPADYPTGGLDPWPAVPVPGYDKTIDPPGRSRFVVVDNCEIYDCYLPLAVHTKFSQVRVHGCYLDNRHDNSDPVVLATPHATITDCHFDAGVGRINAALKDTTPGNNVFTMERNLVRTTTKVIGGLPVTGEGLRISPAEGNQPNQIAQALIANNRFVNESDQPWVPPGGEAGHTTRIPNLSHGQTMLQLTFRDNYVFIPAAAWGYVHAGMPVVAITAHLCENNVYDTDLPAGANSFDVLYGEYVPGSIPPVGVPPRYGSVVRNERFINGFRPSSVADFDTTYPYNGGTIAYDKVAQDAGGGRIFRADQLPAAGTWAEGDLIVKNAIAPEESMGWMCTRGGPVGIAVFTPLPSLGA